MIMADEAAIGPGPRRTRSRRLPPRSRPPAPEEAERGYGRVVRGNFRRHNSCGTRSLLVARIAACVVVCAARLALGPSSTNVWEKENPAPPRSCFHVVGFSWDGATFSRPFHPLSGPRRRRPSASPWSTSSSLPASTTIHSERAPRTPVRRGDTATPTDDDRRPHEQRVAGPRPARRLNHAFRYLYRGGGNDSDAVANLPDDPLQFLLGVGYTETEVLELSRRFPPLLRLSVAGQLAPKVRFLRETLQLDVRNATERAWVPPELYGLKLEATVAPRHALLMHARLPCGRRLVDVDDDAAGGGSTSAGSAVPVLWSQFVKNCRRSTKHFAAFCRSLQSSSLSSSTAVYPVITSRHVEAFHTVFSRGLLAAARDDLVQPGNAVWNPLEILDALDASQLVSLLVSHGGNATELDHRGATLLHWACGTGHLKAARVLSRHVPVTSEAERDGATPLHWAAAGATPHEFGTGGHADVCQYLMEQVQCPTVPSASFPHRGASLRQYINRPTKDGNTPLMWAAWSGTLDTVKLLVRNCADAQHKNRNGCTVAHWAASGGNVQVCRYLRDAVGADFTAPNHGGNTPLTHAVAFGRAGVVEWLTQEVLLPSGTDESLAGWDDEVRMSTDATDTAAAAARSLAESMVRWTGGEQQDRNQVLRLFDEWARHEIGTAGQPECSDDPGDDDEDLWLR